MQFLLPQPILHAIAVALVAADLAKSHPVTSVNSRGKERAVNTMSTEVMSQPLMPDTAAYANVNLAQNEVVSVGNQNVPSDALEVKSPLSDKAEAQFFGGFLRKIFKKKKKPEPVPEYGTEEDTEWETDAESIGAEGPAYTESDTFGLDFGADFDFSLEDPQDMREYFEKAYYEKQKASDDEYYDYFNVLDDISHYADDEYDDEGLKAQDEEETFSHLVGSRAVAVLTRNRAENAVPNKAMMADSEIESKKFIQFPETNAEKIAATLTSDIVEDSQTKGETMQSSNGAKAERKLRKLLPLNRKLRATRSTQGDSSDSEDSDDEGDGQLKNSPTTVSVARPSIQPNPTNIPQERVIGHPIDRTPAIPTQPASLSPVQPTGLSETHSVQNSTSTLFFRSSDAQELMRPSILCLVALVGVTLL